MKRHNSFTKLTILSLLIGLTAALLPAVSSAQADSDAIGAGWWKLNQEKSTYSSASPALARQIGQTRHYYLRNDGFWVMSIFTDMPNGQRAFSQTVFKLDGQPRPSTYTAETLAEFQATRTRATARAAQTAIDSNTVEIKQLAEDGSVVATLTRAVAADSNSFTLTTDARDFEGRPVETVQVFERIR